MKLALYAPPDASTRLGNFSVANPPGNLSTLRVSKCFQPSILKRHNLLLSDSSFSIILHISSKSTVHRSVAGHDQESHSRQGNCL